MIRRTFIFLAVILLIALFAIPAGILLALTVPLFLVSVFPLIAIGLLYLGSRLEGLSWLFDGELERPASAQRAQSEPSFNQVIFQRHTFVIRRYELN
ncbi:MAG: hypothetical protein CMR00_09275 [[Chlorobium] sp. 445]|nr:MAG: hypothetical protein CMR00_09275 [[Chlorobium] sp. 445]